MSAPTANANGIVHSVYPEYSIGGWTIMLGWRSSGSSPTPSAGAGFASANGLARNAVSPAKKPAKTEEHRGRVRRRRRAGAGRVRASTRLDHSDSSQTHSSREPSCDDHTAVAR